MSKLVEIDDDVRIRFSGERAVHAVNHLSPSPGEGERPQAIML